MRQETFVNDRTGVIYRRLTKAQAFKLFQDGHTIVIAPVKANMIYIFRLWAVLCYNPADRTTEAPKQTFERLVNSFKYYNCNNELGQYCKFFAPSTVCDRYL
mgnify:CR=1 FL=1